ncbi:hypothetical protein JTB14_037399 [Gonioctena quinquepunctata]|nr:hypothetical protein JTB14_037399 [Gonioctena quinquepunctata]
MIFLLHDDSNVKEFESKREEANIIFSARKMEQNNQPSCPICENYRSPPAHNCVSENPANSSVLHSLYTEVYFRCKYSKEGCPFVARGWEIKVHERVCAHGLWVCPLQEKFHCSWEGKKNLILPHLQEEHPDELLDEVGRIWLGKRRMGFARRILYSFPKLSVRCSNLPCFSTQSSSYSKLWCTISRAACLKRSITISRFFYRMGETNLA